MMSESVWQDWSLEKEPDCVTVTGGTIGQRGRPFGALVMCLVSLQYE